MSGISMRRQNQEKKNALMQHESLLLNQPVSLVEAFGEPELSFIGSGRVGAGGTPDGAWDYLIGPTYSSPNFLDEERLHVGWLGGRNRPLAPAMHRVAGSGLLCGTQRLGDLAVELWEVAPWDSQVALRIVALTNRGRAPLDRLRVQAFVRAPGKPAIQGQELHIPLPAGTASYGGECPSWADRLARLAWNRPAHLCDDRRDNVGTGFFLTCDLGDLAPGTTVVAALVHRLDEGIAPTALDLSAEPAALRRRFHRRRAPVRLQLHARPARRLPGAPGRRPCRRGGPRPGLGRPQGAAIRHRGQLQRDGCRRARLRRRSQGHRTAGVLPAARGKHN